MAREILKLENINKIYNAGLPTEVTVLHNVNLSVRAGEFLALIGPSGSGKSTLLNIIGLLDRPSSGRLFIHGKDTGALNESQLTSLRAHSIGFVFQYHMLISAFTARENVMMPLLVDREFPDDEMSQRAAQLISRVGLDNVSNNRVANMSGGQQQRVAIARALAMNPDLLS